MARAIRLTSRDNPLLVRLRKLVAQPEAYRRIGAVWLEGEALCRAWLEHAAGAAEQAVIGASAQEIPALSGLAAKAAAVAVVPDAMWAGLSTLETPAGLAYVVRWPGPGAIIAGAPSVVLDRIQDAGNVGTILRSAAAFGYTQVVALKGTAALWSPKVMRAAMGAHFALNLVESAEPAALDALAVPLLATSPHAAAALDRAALPWPCAWLLGSEGQGVAEALLRRCASSVRIPQPGGGESLNVAVAAAICMFESARRRLPT
jgi:TrmH family RNA methyltransferase